MVQWGGHDTTVQLQLAGRLPRWPGSNRTVSQSVQIRSSTEQNHHGACRCAAGGLGAGPTSHCSGALSRVAERKPPQPVGPAGTVSTVLRGTSAAWHQHRGQSRRQRLTLGAVRRPQRRAQLNHPTHHPRGQEGWAGYEGIAAAVPNQTHRPQSPLAQQGGEHRLALLAESLVSWAVFALTLNAAVSDSMTGTAELELHVSSRAPLTLSYRRAHITCRPHSTNAGHLTTVDEWRK
jgi:hypothetical protein